MKICCFAGHSNIYDDQEKLKFNLKNEIIKLIEKEKVNIFYCGGKGAFDWLHKSGCCQLKEQIDELTTKLNMIEVEHAVNNKTFDGKETNISKLTNLYESYCKKLARVLFDYGARLSDIKQLLKRD